MREPVVAMTTGYAKYLFLLFSTCYPLTSTIRVRKEKQLMDYSYPNGIKYHVHAQHDTKQKPPNTNLCF